MSYSERRFAILVGAAALLAVTMPGILAGFFAGEGLVYGGLLLNPLDGNTYLAKMYQGWRGEWVFQLPYTPDTGRGAFINMYYILGGHFARLAGLRLDTVFQLMRLAGSAALLLSLWRAFSRMLGTPFQRKAAFLISSVCLGSGWMLLLAGTLPADLWIAEAYPLLAMLTNAHFPLALALVVYLVVPPQQTDGCGWKCILRDAGLAFLLGVVSPFGVPIALLPWAGLIMLRLFRGIRQCMRLPADLFAWLEVRKAAAIFLGGMPVIAYSLLAIRSDPLLSAWNRQNLTLTPPIWNLFFSLSPALVLALFARRGGGDAFKSWAVLSLVLVLLPHPLQRRFLMGIQIPLAALAAVGLSELRARRPFAARAAGWLFIPGPLVLFIVIGAGIQARSPLLYYTADEEAAMLWIEERTPPDSVVLASPEMGLFIPARTGRRVLYGHPFETVNAEEQRALVEEFFEGLPPEDALEVLEQGNVDYVLVGPREVALGELPELDSLEAVFESGEVRIYAVAGP